MSGLQESPKGPEGSPRDEQVRMRIEALRAMIEEEAAAGERGKFVDGEAVMAEWRRRDAAARRARVERGERR